MILYLHGFASGPSSQKAQYFRRRLGELGIQLLVPALDEGAFPHLTLSRQLRLIEDLCASEKGPPVLIGSSLGGYLAALHAAAHPVTALVLMAPAVDFAASWRARLGAAAVGAWRDRGTLPVWHYGQEKDLPLGYEFLEDAARHERWPAVRCPTLVLHGRRDEVVPLARVERWVERNPGARLVLYNAGHELTEVLGPLFEEARSFLAGVPEVLAAHPQLR